MLILGIKPGDYIVIGDDIVIQAVMVDNLLRLGVEAPRDVLVQRSAVYEAQHPTPACIERVRALGNI